MQRLCPSGIAFDAAAALRKLAPANGGFMRSEA
jgi:hypothetical protein